MNFVLQPHPSTSRLHMHLGSFTATDGLKSKANPFPWLRMSMAKIAPSAFVWEITATKLDPPPPAVVTVVPFAHPVVLLPFWWIISSSCEWESRSRKWAQNYACAHTDEKQKQHTFFYLDRIWSEAIELVMGSRVCCGNPNKHLVKAILCACFVKRRPMKEIQ